MKEINYYGTALCLKFLVFYVTIFSISIVSSPAFRSSISYFKIVEFIFKVFFIIISSYFCLFLIDTISTMYQILLSFLI